jgi:hypothetical protein
MLCTAHYVMYRSMLWDTFPVADLGFEEGVSEDPCICAGAKSFKTTPIFAQSHPLVFEFDDEGRCCTRIPGRPLFAESAGWPTHLTDRWSRTRHVRVSS